MASDQNGRPDPKPMLVGWDDGKIYLYLSGKEYRISDDLELVKRMIALCEEYFARKSHKELAQE